MKIAILNGSPRTANTASMVKAFAEGAEAAGHEVAILHVGKMRIAGCLGCEYCHTKGDGKCVQNDDMVNVMPAYLDSDMIVYASPVYYFGMTAQIMAAMQRIYCIGKPAKATKAALLLSSGSPDVYDGPIGTYKKMLSYIGLQDMGIFTAPYGAKGAETILETIRAFAGSLE